MRTLTDTELVQLFSHVPRFGRAFWSAPPPPPEEFPDLNMTHVKTLVFLRLRGPAPLSAVARWVNLEKGSFTPVARRLAAAGFVETVRDETDRRRTLIRLSEKGAAFDRALHDRMSAEFGRRLAALTDEEQAAFFEAVSRMNELLDRMAAAEGGRPPFPDFLPGPPLHPPPFHGRAPGAQEGTRRCSD